MNNLHREFLFSDDAKYIPIQLLRTSFGFSSSDPNLSEEQSTRASEQEYKELVVRFPTDSSTIVILIEDSENGKIVDIQSSPPGSSSATLKIYDKSYNIYVISKEYNDGFVSESHGVIGELESGRLSVNQDNMTNTINLSDSMVKSYDETDQKQWYNYSEERYYSGDLIWQYNEAADINSENKYLIYKLDMLNHISSFAYTQEIGLVENPTERWQAVRALRVLYDTYEYLTSPQVRSVVNEYQELQEFYDVMNEFIIEITDDNLSLDPGPDGYKNLYYWAEKRYFADGIHIESPRHWFNNNGGEVREDDYDLYYTSLRNKTTTKSMEDWKLRWGGRELFAAMRSTTSQAQPHDEDDDRIRGLLRYLYDSTGEYQQMDNFFETYGIPHSTVIRDNGGRIPGEPYRSNGDEAFFAYILEKANQILNNMVAFVREQIVQTEATMAGLGDYIFSPSTFNPDNFDLNAYEAKMNLLNSALLTIRNFAIGNSVVNLNQLHSGGDPEIGLDDLERADDAVDAIRANINSQSVNKEQLPVVIANLQRGKDYLNGINMLMLSEEHITQEYYQYYNEVINNVDYYSKIYDYYANLNDQVEEAGGGSNLPPLAHEATLQNIRFLKKMITAVSDNVWATMNNTTSIVLSSLIDIANSIAQQTNSLPIFNITSTHVDDSDITVEYAMYSGGGLEWKELGTDLIRTGNGTITLNLNGEEFKTPGKYVIAVKPKEVWGELSEISGDIAKVSSEQLTKYKGKNDLYGWNAQVYDTNGKSTLGDEKIITASEPGVRTSIKVSPLFSTSAEFQANTQIKMWNNKFIPVLIEVSIVNHTPQTLSYGIYGRKEMNVNTGLCTIYDHNGNVYKQLSYGKYSNEQTGGAMIEYRDPIPTTGYTG